MMDGLRSKVYGTKVSWARQQGAWEESRASVKGGSHKRHSDEQDPKLILGVIHEFGLRHAKTP